MDAVGRKMQSMSGVLIDLLVTAVDEAEFRRTLSRLTILYWLAGSLPEPQADGTRDQQAERLRRAAVSRRTSSKEYTRYRVLTVAIAGDRKAG